jgi:hypothetical protein
MRWAKVTTPPIANLLKGQSSVRIMAEGKSTSGSSRAELMVKTMVMKKLRNEGSIPDVAGLEDIEIPPEHEELLTGLTKLFKSADKNYLTLAELREFVSSGSVKRAKGVWSVKTPHSYLGAVKPGITEYGSTTE